MAAKPMKKYFDKDIDLFYQNMINTALVKKMTKDIVKLFILQEKNKIETEDEIAKMTEDWNSLAIS